ncbi:MAG TPA: MarR family transcriptional regulator [Beijerinckiaceae bacterium]|nr:MarR family transcriptional regulator [Beijerinckiaceae bacterium]
MQNERVLAPGARKADDADLRHDLANRLFFRLYQASNLLHKVGTKAVSGFGATTQQWAVLGALARQGNERQGLSIKQLMEYLLTSRQNLTLVLDRLEGQGLVERVRGTTDARVRHVRLTAQGRKTWEEMLVDIRAFYGQATEGFSTEEVFLLFRLLDRLKDRLSAL